jgi:hypothetical protein
MLVPVGGSNARKSAVSCAPPFVVSGPMINGDACGNPPLGSAFRYFVPSLSWQSDRFAYGKGRFSHRRAVASSVGIEQLEQREKLLEVLR